MCKDTLEPKRTFLHREISFYSVTETVPHIRAATNNYTKLRDKAVFKPMISIMVALVVYWLVCLPLDPKVAGSNPTKAMDF
jgi:hypothetical protein